MFGYDACDVAGRAATVRGGEVFHFDVCGGGKETGGDDAWWSDAGGDGSVEAGELG
jgi:hypothetical protein